MAQLRDLSMIELAVQWHASESRIEKFEKRLNRMYSDTATRKDLVMILNGQGEELQERLTEALDLQASSEYWLRNRGTSQEQIEKWNIKPKTERFDNYDKT